MVKRYQDIVRGVTPICEEAPVHHVHERRTNRIIGTHSATRGFQPSRPGEYQKHTGSKILPHSMRIGDRIESGRLSESTHGGVGPWHGTISSPYTSGPGPFDITMTSSDGTTKTLQDVDHPFSNEWPTLDDYAAEHGSDRHLQHAAFINHKLPEGQDFVDHVMKHHGVSYPEAEALKNHIEQCWGGVHNRMGTPNGEDSTTYHPLRL